jgi:predicted ribosome quality control (RQC) complex YloA/Tae2 family protein
MNFTDIEKAVSEISRVLCGAKIDKVQQLDGGFFLFSLIGVDLPRPRILLISVRRNSQRFHLLYEPVHRDYLLKTPDADILTRRLSGGRIRTLKVADSQVRFLIDGGTDPALHLIADFNRNDLMLLDDGAVVAYRLRKNGEDPGRVYVPSAQVSNCRVCSDEGSPATVSFPFNRSLSDEFIETRNRILAAEVARILRVERKKITRLLNKLHAEVAEVKDKERFREMGELLKYSLNDIRRGDSSACLTGFDGNPVTVDLDPVLGPLENMNRYFQRYKKLKRREAVIGNKIAYEERRLAMLDELIEKVGSGNALSISRQPLQFIDAMDAGVLTRGLQDRIRKLFYPVQKAGRDSIRGRAGKFLRFTTRSGKTVLVGRNGRENEELTLRRARGNDLWFHVEAGPGSHVILRYDKKTDFHDSDIIDACMLALYFSPSRRRESADIVYTHRKHVRKPKGTPDGYVTYHKNKTKHVVLDDSVLKHLLDSKPQAMELNPGTRRPALKDRQSLPRSEA